MKFIAIVGYIGRKHIHSRVLCYQHPGKRFCDHLLENITLEFLRAEVATGCAIVSANINHLESEPMIIGHNFFVKVNVIIGNSAVTSFIEEKVRKLVWFHQRWGVDTVVDLSTRRYIHATCDWILREVWCPFVLRSFTTD